MASQELLDYYSGLRDDRIIVCLAFEIAGVEYLFTDEIFDYTCLIDGVSTDFEARALVATKPKRDGTGTFSSSIKIDDVDRLFWRLLKDIDRQSAHFVTIHLVLVGTGKNEQSWSFQIESSSFDGYTCSIEAVKPKIVNQKFPNKIYSVDTFVGLESDL